MGAQLFMQQQLCMKQLWYMIKQTKASYYWPHQASIISGLLFLGRKDGGQLGLVNTQQALKQTKEKRKTKKEKRKRRRHVLVLGSL